MRRAQSARHHARRSLALGTDDLGVLREADESPEDGLRRQLLEKSRENDKLQATILSLQAQLSERPPIEHIQELEKEYKDLELLLQGTQRENERCMSELERGRNREKMLEQALAKVAGENWQSSLDIAPTSSAIAARAVRRSTLLPRSTAPPNGSSNGSDTSAQPSSQASHESTMAYMDQIRMLILGMEKQIQTREETLTKTIERAEGEKTKYENIRKEVLAEGL
ncbi:hypothetical protein SERLA73DRAFT_83108 [Serpula lacrymans var. lacrymans S7.3]|uniref:Uncharacterized protein n=2 Tax=Serpula lacrymans var. lacrymans TaxID=341189 RepID=F8PGJ7_SERL3|nr:uncharacterized protein SERLADRAFT_412666 [Serpula lacrymans var. lacrymans S7.9]EGO05430.1 hypothetical protein SERLA73DRAFT_83108 [Serpula lacrymans var. lacrymans S7.3]EGO31277.1 hypothetical protein SERLADRAFT_412666 [Serpula lacrymans var. lacrymans S7.9]